MKSNISKTIMFLIALLGLTNLAYAGHGGNSIREAAGKLDRAASKFYERTYYEYGRGQLSYEAKSLAKATHRFCNKVERGVPFGRLWREFSQLQYRYDQLRNELQYSRASYGPFTRGYGGHDDRRHGKGLGFKKVRKWFERLDQAMYREHERYGQRRSRQRNDAHHYAHNDSKANRRNRRLRSAY